MSKGDNSDFREVSWFDLTSWAGSRVVSRGKSYQQGNLVKDLVLTQAGDIMAWVHGSAKYATKVSFVKGSLSSVCTCPYYGACKHAVAVVLEYLEGIENVRNTPMTAIDDERLLLLDVDAEFPDDNDDPTEDVETGNRTSESGVDDYLEKKSKEELVDLIKGIVSRDPELGGELNYKARIAHGKPTTLVKTVKREILKATSEPGWRNYWKHTGYTPDYSRVRDGLQELLDEGHADEVVRLGEKLFSAGTDQVEQSNDEGETADEVADVLRIVFKALGECSLDAVDKMEKAVDFRLRDEYGLCSGLEMFWKQRFGRKDWNALAVQLLKRLDALKHEKSEDSFSRDYRRDRLTDEIIRALENAGRKEEMIDLCMKEAERTGSYDRLVSYLRKARRIDDAEAWIRKGITATSDKLPGIASSLKKELLDIRTVKKDWVFIASLHFDDFVEDPGLAVYQNLKKFSEKTQVWPIVREAALHFLETGKRPAESRSDWPLPDTGIKTTSRRSPDKPPYADVLIDIAVYEKRTEDVLKWFEVYNRKESNWPNDNLKDNVASAIAREHPDKAIMIWKELAEKNMAETNVSAYETGAQYLRKAMKIMMQTGKGCEWETYLRDLKTVHRRRPRCIQILDALSEKPIIQSKR